jgi:hypothetical protein
VTINEHLDTFLDIMRHSVINDKSADVDKQFAAKYVNSSDFWAENNLTLTTAKVKPTNVQTFLFCGMLSNFKVPAFISVW